MRKGIIGPQVSRFTIGSDSGGALGIFGVEVALPQETGIDDIPEMFAIGGAKSEK